MRKVLLAFAALLVLSLAHAISPNSASITVVVGPDGVASVREEYLFLFKSAEDYNQFYSIARLAGDSFQIWSSYVPDVTYHVGNDFTKLSGINIYWVDLGRSAARLVVSYSVHAAFEKDETPTSKVFIISAFRFPTSAGAMHVPEGYTITVYLPQNAKILEYEPNIADHSSASDNVVVWRGPLSVGSMYIVYSVPKPAFAPSLLSILAGTPYSIYIVAFLVLLVVIIFWRWERIKKAIERYVSDNTRFEE
jgi:hypothetical protein